eukprot:TRINITY_DN2736_c0_g1_i2.p1 TRINITY_DN2736_c0_g1~~TRINITY_DN2736_c0_g1_i2.p1  ORF type:complete len:236 (+),score=38.61 TRINITY_DN2736_c0_g1_i2:608-1315(+)
MEMEVREEKVGLSNDMKLHQKIMESGSDALLKNYSPLINPMALYRAPDSNSLTILPDLPTEVYNGKGLSAGGDAVLVQREAGEVPPPQAPSNSMISMPNPMPVQIPIPMPVQVPLPAPVVVQPPVRVPVVQEPPVMQIEPVEKEEKRNGKKASPLVIPTDTPRLLSTAQVLERLKSLRPAAGNPAFERLIDYHEVHPTKSINDFIRQNQMVVTFNRVLHKKGITLGGGLNHSSSS